MRKFIIATALLAAATSVAFAQTNSGNNSNTAGGTTEATAQNGMNGSANGTMPAGEQKSGKMAKSKSKHAGSANHSSAMSGFQEAPNAKSGKMNSDTTDGANSKPASDIGTGVQRNPSPAPAGTSENMRAPGQAGSTPSGNTTN